MADKTYFEKDGFIVTKTAAYLPWRITDTNTNKIVGNYKTLKSAKHWAAYSGEEKA